MSDPARNPGTGFVAPNCAAWSARTSRSTIPTRRWRAFAAAGARADPPATDAQVMASVARYGEFVLLKPRPSPTLLLWLLPRWRSPGRVRAVGL
jgi:hypothetical protein